MTISVNQAAKLVCELTEWQATNLYVQKILYIAHVIHMGDSGGDRLIDGSFQAWDYGPVNADLYHHIKAFGDKPIRNVFKNIDIEEVRESSAGTLIMSVVKVLSDKQPWELVQLTHREHGAWAKTYDPKSRYKVIKDEDILEEYKATNSND